MATDGEIYLTGTTNSFGGLGTCGSYPSPYTCYDASLLKIDTAGALISSQTWGGSLDDAGASVLADSSGNAIVTAFVSESPPYSISAGNYTLGAPTFSPASLSIRTNNLSYPTATPSGTVAIPLGSETYAGGQDTFITKFYEPPYLDVVGIASISIGFGGDNLLIQGSGWQPGVSVNLSFNEPNAKPHSIDSVLANSSGMQLIN